MEVASGDYGSDLTKILASAVKKLYSNDRENFNGGIIIEEQLAVTDGEISYYFN